jgi:D-hydroxyproline dehydrogenase subunit alpha
VRDRFRAFERRLEAAFAPRDELRDRVAADTIVCRCEDVGFGSLQPGWSARQAKLYTRAGMGPCQGRVCGPALEHLFGYTFAAARAPIVPATVSTLLAPAAAGGEPSEHR